MALTVNVPPRLGVTQSSRGLPASTTALLVQTTLPPFVIVRLIVEIFESENWTPARAPLGSVRESRAIVGGLCRSAKKCDAVLQ